jgi:hypothetical protein
LPTGFWDFFKYINSSIVKSLEWLPSHLDKLTAPCPAPKAKPPYWHFSFFFFFIFFDRLLLCRPSWHQTCNAPASASWVLGLQACITIL